MGSFVVDLMGRAEHLPLPGETVKGSFFKAGPGGKGSNQAVAARRMGADVLIATKVGRDGFGDMAVENFEKEGFDTELVFRDPEASTGTALILVDENTSQNSILVTLSACERINADDMNLIRRAVDDADILLTQLETNVDAVEQIVEHASASGKLVILNPAPVQPVSDAMYGKIDIFTPNEVEAGILSGMEVKNPEDAEKAASFFLAKGVKDVVITMGSSGVFMMNENEAAFIESHKVDAIDTTGAGDAFNGGLAAALSEGLSLKQAVVKANAVAALSVTKMGTAPAMPFENETTEFLKNLNNKERICKC